MRLDATIRCPLRLNGEDSKRQRLGHSLESFG
jgi:hypothetical protein